MNHTQNLQQTLLLAQAVRSGGESAAPAATQTQTTKAADSAPAASSGAALGGGMGQLFNMLAPILLVVVIYFLIFRPQQKREKERLESIKKINKGDKILTRGGIYGIVVGLRLEEEIIVLKIADNVKVEVHTNAVDSVNPSAATNKKK